MSVLETTEFETVREVSMIISQTADYREGLRLTMASVARRVQVEACSVLVHDETSDQLVLEATHGLTQMAVGTVRMSANQGITGYCYRTGHVVNVADKREHPEFHRFADPRSDEYRSLLAVPLKVGGRVIGVLDFERNEAKAFEPRLVDMALAMAAPLAVFILNANLARVMKTTEAHPEQRNRLKEALSGKPITDGVVRGDAYFVTGADVLTGISLAYSEDPADELRLLEQAFMQALEDTARIQDEATDLLAEADADVFAAHLMLLQDPTLRQRLGKAVEEGFALRFAVKLAIQDFEKQLRALDNEFMLERLADLKDVLISLLRAADELRGLANGTELPHQSDRPLVIAARELLPSQLVRIPLRHVVGIVCEEGGTTTHVAILARTLRIPMLVGVPDVGGNIRQNDDIILDCNAGLCYVKPNEELIARFQPALAHFRHETDETSDAEASTETLLADGTDVRLGGNVSLISELPLLKRYGARGVGLYRTEFMFMIRGAYPPEDEQYRVFKRVVEAGDGSSVTVRVLDVGGDKPLPYVKFGHEDNPFLGWRGVRFLLSNPQYFEPHLRAILRTTVHGRVNVLLPMVADMGELEQILETLAEVRGALADDGIACADDVRVGIMLEVPSALWDLEAMLPHIDFVSLGTNDLTQYLFAVDRGNARVSRWYRQFHPVVLRVIGRTSHLVQTVHGKPLSVCGELAGLPTGAALLCGAGVRYLSMNPWQIPRVRATLARLRLRDCEELFQAAMEARDDARVTALLDEFAAAHDVSRAPS